MVVGTTVFEIINEEVVERGVIEASMLRLPFPCAIQRENKLKEKELGNNSDNYRCRREDYLLVWWHMQSNAG